MDGGMSPLSSLLSRDSPHELRPAGGKVLEEALVQIGHEDGTGEFPGLLTEIFQVSAVEVRGDAVNDTGNFASVYVPQSCSGEDGHRHPL
jgi:hypothetical protein